LTIDTSSIKTISTRSITDPRYSELMSRIKELSKDKDPRKKIIAQIATNLLGKQEKNNDGSSLEVIKTITDPQILQGVKK